MVKKEICVNLLAYNLIRTNIAQAAKQHSVLPRLISFKAAVQLLSAAMRQLNFSNKTSFLNFYKTILKAIASTKIGGRKRKAQPRA
ncbi:IS4 family transposase, partial [Pseudomonadota bacterium]